MIFLAEAKSWLSITGLLGLRKKQITNPNGIGNMGQKVGSDAGERLARRYSKYTDIRHVIY